MRTGVRRVHVLRLDEGSDLVNAVKNYCSNNEIRGGVVSAIGTLKTAILGAYLGKERGYVRNSFKGLFELASCVGNVSRVGDEVVVHLHAVLADESGRTIGGHLFESEVAFTVEVAIMELDQELQRAKDEKTGLNVLEV